MTTKTLVVSPVPISPKDGRIKPTSGGKQDFLVFMQRTTGPHSSFKKAAQLLAELAGMTSATGPRFIVQDVREAKLPISALRDANSVREALNNLWNSIPIVKGFHYLTLLPSSSGVRQIGGLLSAVFIPNTVRVVNCSDPQEVVRYMVKHLAAAGINYREIVEPGSPLTDDGAFIDSVPSTNNPYVVYLEDID